MINKIPVSKVIYLDTDIYGCDNINLYGLINNLIAAAMDRLPWTSSVVPEHLRILNSL